MCSQDYPNLNEISSSQTKELVNAYRSSQTKQFVNAYRWKARGKRAANNKLDIEQQNEENRNT